MTDTKIDVRVDGVPQVIHVPEQSFMPKGILEHEYLPMEYCVVKEYASDLIYMTSYWEVERIWKVFLANKEIDVYDRLLSKFLNGQIVVVNYGTGPRIEELEVYIPKTTKLPGFSVFYAEIMKEIKEMSSEQLEEHMDEVGYNVLYRLGMRRFTRR